MITTFNIFEDRKIKELLTFFARFTDITKFYASVYIFLVKQLVPSIYEANDHYKRADRYLELIEDLYVDNNYNFILNKFDI